LVVGAGLADVDVVVVTVMGADSGGFASREHAVSRTVVITSNR
jgi:hypothetical protein